MSRPKLCLLQPKSHLLLPSCMVHLRVKSVETKICCFYNFQKFFLNFQWWKYTFFKKCSKSGLVSEKKLLHIFLLLGEGFRPKSGTFHFISIFLLPFPNVNHLFRYLWMNIDYWEFNQEMWRNRVMNHKIL